MLRRIVFAAFVYFCVTTTVVGADYANNKSVAEDADFSLSRRDLSVQSVVNSSSGNYVLLIGSRGFHVFENGLYLGAGGFGGMTVNQSKSNDGWLAYGGIIAGREFQISSSKSYVFSEILLGAGGGANGDISGKSEAYALNLGVAYAFAKGTYVVGELGYLKMPSADYFSGTTLGISVVFRYWSWAWAAD